MNITGRVFQNTPPPEELSQSYKFIELYIRKSSTREDLEREALAVFYDLDYANPNVEFYLWDIGRKRWIPTSASSPFPENGYQVGDDSEDGACVLEVVVQRRPMIE